MVHRSKTPIFCTKLQHILADNTRTTELIFYEKTKLATVFNTEGLLAEYAAPHYRPYSLLDACLLVRRIIPCCLGLVDHRAVR